MFIKFQQNFIFNIYKPPWTLSLSLAFVLPLLQITRVARDHNVSDLRDFGYVLIGSVVQATDVSSPSVVIIWLLVSVEKEEGKGKWKSGE